MGDPNTGYCHLCAAPLTPGDLDAILDHVRVIHPDAWGDGPERWPDGGLVMEVEIDDETPVGELLDAPWADR